jgi:hypothetical protein
LVPNNRREPYRGTPQSVGDVISGQATFTSGVSLLPHVRVGTLSD